VIVTVIINEAVDDKQLGLGNDEDGNERLTRCLSPDTRYPCYATDHVYLKIQTMVVFYYCTSLHIFSCFI